MNLARMMTDKFFIEDQEGTRRGPFKTKFGSGTITVFQDDFHAVAGDRIVQPLSNGSDASDGRERVFLVESCSFSTGSRNIPGHYSIRLSEPITIENKPNAGTGALLESHGAPGCNINRLDLAAIIQSLAQAIEQANFPAEQKEQAQSLVRALCDNPVICAVLAKKAPDS